jgi:hypothetical protein
MLVPILNGDLGRLYQMVGDLKTLEDILDRPSAPVKEIRAQIDETRQRLGNIYQLNGILAHEHKLIGEIESVLKQPTPKLSAKLTGLIEAMEDLLDKETKKVISPKDVKVGAGMPRGNKPAGFVGLMIAKKKLGRTPNFYVPPAQEKNTPELFDADLIQEPSRYIKEEMYEYSTRVRQGIQKLKDIKNKSAIQKFALKYKEYFGANKDDVAKFITQYKRNDVVGAVYSANSAVGGIMFLYLMKKYKNDCFIAQYDKDYQRFKEGIHFNGKKFSVPLADLRKDMKECIKKPSNKLIVIPLTLEATTKKQKKAGSHQNMLIYRVEQNTLERYEPHGVATGATEALGYSNEVTDTAVRDLFKEKLKEITERAGVPEFRYLASADLHLKKNFDAVKPAWDGFQAIENREQQTRKLDYDGFCMAWSYFYLELVLKFPAESGQTLVNRAEALLNKEGAVRVLQHILGYVENMEKEIGDLMKAVGKSSFKFQTFRDLSARPRPAGAEDAYWEWIDWYNRQIKWFMFSDARRARLSKEGRGITVGCCDGKDEVESME